MPIDRVDRLFAASRALMPLAAAITTLLLAGADAARAHPHIIADVSMELIYDDQDRITGIRETWAYDAFYSSIVRRMADADRDGKVSDAERAAFGDQQIKALAEFGYYTKLISADAQVPLGPAADYDLIEDSNGQMALRFTVPVQTPLHSRAYRIEIFDPAFFAYFTTTDSRSIRFTGAKPNCSFAVTTPQPIDLKNTRSVPAALWKALDGSAADGRQFINSVAVSCR